MPITVRCEECGETFEAPNRLAGGYTECAICGEETRVPKKSVRTSSKKSAEEREGLRKVGHGLGLILLSIISALVFVVYVIVGGIAMPDLIGPTVGPLGNLVGIGCPILTIVGTLLCLFVPARSRAAGIIYASVALQVISIVAMLAIMFGLFRAQADVAANPDAAGLAVLNMLDLSARMMFLSGLCSITGTILFVVFLAKLATYLNLPVIAGKAMSVLYIGGSCIAAAFVVGVLGDQLHGGIIGLVALGLFVAGIVAFVRYVGTLSALREEIKATT